eukprot:scaffold174337_cov23-Tisochrysis_lutea.AAC.1
MQESVCDHETIWNRNMLSRHKPHSRCAPHSAKGKRLQPCFAGKYKTSNSNALLHTSLQTKLRGACSLHRTAHL